MNYEITEKKIKEMLTKNKSSTILQDVVDVLYESFEKYSWVGIYLVEGDVLVLGPWKGKQATEHTKISVGKGVCGSAARSGKTEVVNDVSKDNRYLSCFRSTRSEIVVPITRNSRVIGEIDIDSDVPAAFNKTDKKFLEKIADMLCQHI
ncbi:MAG: GAF domain-containing protein [Euryarchaeota archaeon]|nr:GAF domain-containing protein [Euryarchaeota archaeon]